jgi:hypothetical protein
MAEEPTTDRPDPNERLLISLNMLIRRLDMLMTPPAPRDTTTYQPIYMSGRWLRRNGNDYGLDPITSVQQANYPIRRERV